MEEPIDPAKIKKEKEKGRQLRKTQWWLAKRNAGVCHFCEKTFPADEITMDHIVPLSRGGKSTRGNVVPACKECNTKKKTDTPVDLLLRGKFNSGETP